MKQNNLTKSVRYITRAAMIAALYAILTYVSAIAGLAYHSLQFRISEALCVLPMLMPEAIPGLFVGCIIGNLINPEGFMVLDIVFGSLATLIAAHMTYKIGYYRPAIRSSKYWLAALMPVIFNIVITGPVVLKLYGFDLFSFKSDGWNWKLLPLCMLTVGFGEVVCVLGLGTLFYKAMLKLPEQVLK